MSEQQTKQLEVFKTPTAMVAQVSALQQLLAQPLLKYVVKAADVVHPRWMYVCCSCRCNVTVCDRPMGPSA